MTGTQSSPNAPVIEVRDCPGIQFLRYERGLTDAEHEAFLARAERDMARVPPGHRHVLVIDVNRAERGSPLQRQRQALWQARNEAYFREHVVAAVFVARSPLLRGALRAVGWLRPFPYAFYVVDDLESALAKALELLTAAGLPRPSQADLERLRSRAL